MDKKLKLKQLKMMAASVLYDQAIAKGKEQSARQRFMRAANYIPKTARYPNGRTAQE